MKKTQTAKKKLALNITSIVDLQQVTGGDGIPLTTTLFTVGGGTLLTHVKTDCACPSERCQLP